MFWQCPRPQADLASPHTSADLGALLLMSVMWSDNLQTAILVGFVLFWSLARIRRRLCSARETTL